MFRKCCTKSVYNRIRLNFGHTNRFKQYQIRLVHNIDINKEKLELRKKNVNLHLLVVLVGLSIVTLSVTYTKMKGNKMNVPMGIMWLIFRAHYLERNGNYDKALTFYSKLLKKLKEYYKGIKTLSKEDYLLLLDLEYKYANLLSQTNNFIEAHEIYLEVQQNIVNQESESSFKLIPVKYDIGKNLNKQGKYEDAINNLKNAFNLSILYGNSKENNIDEKYFNKEKLDEITKLICFELGGVYNKINDFENCIFWLKNGMEYKILNNNDKCDKELLYVKMRITYALIRMDKIKESRNMLAELKDIAKSKAIDYYGHYNEECSMYYFIGYLFYLVGNNEEYKEFLNKGRENNEKYKMKMDYRKEISKEFNLVIDDIGV